MSLGPVEPIEVVRYLLRDHRKASNVVKRQPEKHDGSEQQNNELNGTHDCDGPQAAVEGKSNHDDRGENHRHREREGRYGRQENADRIQPHGIVQDAHQNAHPTDSLPQGRIEPGFQVLDGG